MIHTVEIIKQISKEEYKSVKTRYKFNYIINENIPLNKSIKVKSAKDRYKFKYIKNKTINLNYHICKSTDLNYLGINETVLVANYKYHLRLKINLAKVIHGIEFLGVARYDKILDSNYKTIINQIIKNELGLSYTVEEFSVYGIDYAYDYDEPNKEKLMYLLHKSKSLDKRKFTKCNVNNMTSFYAYNKSVVINFYIKQVELRVNHKKNNNKKLYKNVLRFEIQCKYEKVINLQDKYGFDKRKLDYYLNPNMALSIVKGYLSLIIYENDFLLFDLCVYMIENKDKKTITKATKKKLIYLLHLINISENIEQAKERFLSKTFLPEYQNEKLIFCGSINIFGNYITKLKKLQTTPFNPVAIPKKWKIKFIKNPLSKLDSNG